jgi:hypothetical protein
MDKSLLNTKPKRFNQLEQKHGGKLIKKIQVCRYPIMSVFKKIIRTMKGKDKFDEWMASKSYDELYHLYMILELKDGTILRTDKNNRVELKTLKKFSCGDKNGTEDYAPIELKGDLTFTQMVNNAVKSGLVYRYSANEFNCQNYIMMMLKHSNLYNSTIDKFIMQDIQSLIKKNSFIDKLSRFGTDLGALFEKLIQGGGACGCEGSGSDSNYIVLRNYR